ncbi:MAG: TRAP transporter TatT component family protein [Desulfobacteraceae bacterium]|jgi:hypothetical protein
MKDKHTIGYLVMIWALVAALGGVSCSPRRLMVDEFVAMVERGLPAIEQEDDLHLLAKSMPAHIKLLETLLASDPNNRDLLVLLARLYGGYAFAILESEGEARRLERPSVVATGIPDDQLEDAIARSFQHGAEYALRSLENRYPEARVQLNRLSSAADFIQSLDSDDVPALFWYAFNLGGFVQHRLDSVEAMAKAHLVEKAMRRIIEMDETYDNGNAHLVLLVFYASRPAMMGGNSDLARRHYQRHIAMHAPSEGLRETYWARHVLVQQQDKAAFVSHLSAVAQTTEGGRSFSLLDRVAAVRAEIYLESVDRFFD